MTDNSIKVSMVFDRPICQAGIDAVRSENDVWSIAKDGRFLFDAAAEPVPTICISCGAARQPNGQMPCEH